jgi:hypothetical protein
MLIKVKVRVPCRRMHISPLSPATHTVAECTIPFVIPASSVDDGRPPFRVLLAACCCCCISPHSPLACISSQTLTGKEIEIDVEPEDTVRCP